MLILYLSSLLKFDGFLYKQLDLIYGKMPTRIDPENLNAKDVGISEVCKYICTSTGCSSQKDFSKDRRNAFFVMVIKLFFCCAGESSRTPHALQWAVRNAQPYEGAAEGGAHVYVGTNNIRRNASGASANADINNGGNTVFCMPSALARTFGLIMKEVMIAS